MDDLIAEFLTETNESLAALDNDLVRLEQNPNDKSLISSIFRLMHTIKGTCGFLGLDRLQKVAHHAEDVMGRFRDGDLEVNAAYVTLIFESIDRVRYLLAELEMNGSEPEGSDAALIDKLIAVYEGRDQHSAAPAATANDVMVTVDKPAPIESAPADGRGEASPESGVANQTLRVNVEVLENLMTMVSELVLTRNQLLQTARGLKDTDINAPLQRLNQVVSELQDGVMKTRMQPIGNAWQKLPRIIRDISIELGKKIDLEMIGQDTELDRQILEMIKDPLTHMVRNSADHGIEKPVDRIANGKPETGKIILKAFHEGGHIIIQIIDDGKGLNKDRIKAKALQNGLVSENELASMSDHQIYQFIFRAGFSTAEQVTAVSGRGVGMDVVRTNIEKIGGAIELSSIEGRGSTFSIKIPLTLAIVSSLIVESAGERFAIPQLCVRELVLASSDSDNRIEVVKGTPLLRLRNHLLPLISLESILKLSDNQTDDILTAVTKTRKYVIVTQVGSYQFGVLVDRVYDTEEIVVKPVPSLLKSFDIYAGNTILGDGSVIMILDPVGLARATGEIDLSEKTNKASDDDTLRRSDTVALILFRVGRDTAPKAVPLALVSRLEQIKTATIEIASGQMMIQYRGNLMPLVKFAPAVDMEHSEKPALVFNDQGRSLGLLVDEIIDIVESEIDLQAAANGQGIVGSAIIEGKATDLVDVSFFLQSVSQDWFKNHADTPFVSGQARPAGPVKSRVLLVDDSPFFHNMLTPLLTLAGYDVTAVNSAVEALKLCENGQHFDVIVSDIEMPIMDGFEFVAKVKSETPWKDTPVVALTSHATPQDIAHGLQLGFEQYIPKFDRETLLSALAKSLAPHHGGAT